MRRMLALLLSSAIARLPSAQVTTQSVSVPPGTGVEIELLQDVSSETLKAGQTIPFKLVRPVELKGETCCLRAHLLRASSKRCRLRGSGERAAPSTSHSSR